MTLPQGIHSDVPMEAYIGDPAPEPSVSSGVVQRLVEDCPAMARLHHPRLGGWRDEPSGRMDLGSAAHAVLSGGDDAISWVWARDWRTKAAKAARSDAHRSGRVPMFVGLAEDDEYDEAQDRRLGLDAMAGAARAALDLAGHTGGSWEQTLVWQWDGVWCRSRPDWVSDDRAVVVDYKTSDSANPTAWIRGQLEGRNDCQAALCLRGLADVCGDTEREWLWLVQSTHPPYLCSWIGMHPGGQLREVAEAKCRWAVRLWGECLRSGEWPGYDQRVHWAEPSTYQIQRTVDRGIPVPGFSE